jgi:hypothetical protein
VDLILLFADGLLGANRPVVNQPAGYNPAPREPPERRLQAKLPAPRGGPIGRLAFPGEGF